MLGIPLRYVLKHPLSATADLAADPFEALTTVREYIAEEREPRRPQYPYQHDDDWERRLHEHIGVSWPCEVTSEFRDLWSEVIGELQEKGIRAGPESFQWWNDGDAGFVRTIWCLVRHLRPRKIVETGVAHGVTSRFILEALKRNGDGHLWSIDLPPLERHWREQVGVAVGDRFPAMVIHQGFEQAASSQIIVSARRDRSFHSRQPAQRAQRAFRDRSSLGRPITKRRARRRRYRCELGISFLYPDLSRAQVVDLRGRAAAS
jgi:hypothetical protein